MVDFMLCVFNHNLKIRKNQFKPHLVYGYKHVGLYKSCFAKYMSKYFLNGNLQCLKSSKYSLSAIIMLYILNINLRFNTQMQKWVYFSYSSPFLFHYLSWFLDIRRDFELHWMYLSLSSLWFPLPRTLTWLSPKLKDQCVLRSVLWPSAFIFDFPFWLFHSVYISETILYCIIKCNGGFSFFSFFSQ